MNTTHRFSNLVEIEDNELLVKCGICGQYFPIAGLEPVTQSGEDSENPIEVLVCKSHLDPLCVCCGEPIDTNLNWCVRSKMCETCVDDLQ